MMSRKIQGNDPEPYLLVAEKTCIHSLIKEARSARCCVNDLEFSSFLLLTVGCPRTCAPQHGAKTLALNDPMARAIICQEGDGMYRSDTMNEEVAVIIEQYADHAQARLPGLGHEGFFIGATPTAAINQLMEWLHTHPVHTSTTAAPVAVSLLTVPRNTTDLRPPTVVYAPNGVMALFSGDLNPVEIPPPEATWLKPGERIPDDAPDGAVFVIPHRTLPFRANHVVIRSHQGEHRLLHHTDGGVLLAPAGQTVSQIHRGRETSVTSPRGIGVRNQNSDDGIAVIIEQSRDHAEAYLPGMGPAWHTTDVTPDGALEYLLQLARRVPAIPNGTAPIAVSLVTVHPDTVDLHPATVEQAPVGVMVLFSGRLLPREEAPLDAQDLPQGTPIPDNALPGRVFLVPPATDGLDDEGRYPPDAVVLQAQPGEDHRLLHHRGPVVLKFPARLVRIEYGIWGETPGMKSSR